mmetsp:Transcript_21262/g.43526  ORF Transcript_21262/g.43526 Transcript_21262/m.43526 type:complete len:210 (-) Transcript_21262:573-1202(-)
MKQRKAAPLDLNEHWERGGHASIDLGHVHHEVHHTVGVTPLVVVPGHHLHELRVEHDARARVEDARALVALEVGGHQVLVAVAEEALLDALRVLLHQRADVLVGGLLVEHAREVHHRHVSGGHAERHPRQLALEARDDFGDRFSGAGGGRDDVPTSAPPAAPVLVARRVHHFLGRRHGVHRGHEPHRDPVLVVDGLHHGGEAVGGARRA